ncbi:EAL domain-containing protein [Massilia sp. G4R7]|uniref:EAL domain-containing protein n=1 Tax=Massilia phyllostachyos TaxID=2898585 RepID=A0ABS8Q1K1_9BURK|nr:EAL domain-containing protein [Massilia phyllostachyos]
MSPSQVPYSTPSTLSALRHHVLAMVSSALIPVTCILGVTIMISIWLFYADRVEQEKAVARHTATTSGENIVLIVATNLEEVLGRARLYARIAEDFGKSGPANVFRLNPQQVGDSAYVRAAVFDARGELVYSSAGRGQEAELRAVLARALGGGDKGAQAGEAARIAVGYPSAGERTPWRLPVLVRLGEERAARGYYGALVDLGYFLGSYRNVDLGPGGRIEIVHQDGTPLAVMQGGILMPQAAPAEGGGVGQLLAQRALNDIPIRVSVIQDPALLLGKLEAQHHSYLVRSSVYSAIVLVLTLAVSMGLWRQQRLHREVATSEQEKQRLIGQLEQEKVRALALASQDHLTGLANRRMFQEMAAAELKRARRSRNLYALLFFDLDRFKLINDTLGHGVGDQLLKGVAARLRAAVRDYDLVARLGGDEFVVLLSEVPSEEFVAQLAGKLVQNLSAVYPDLDGHDVDTTPSVGIALYPRDGQDLDQLLLHADQAMYSVKSRGRGFFSFYDVSLNASSALHTELAARFRPALQEGEFRLHFQPKLLLETLEVVGLEALIRWDHPEHGLIFPGDFIPLAEEQDFIVRLGRWIIDAVCRQLAAWRLDGVPLVPVAINVSARQLRDDKLTGDFIATLLEHGIEAALIEIEITESSLIEDTPVAQRNLDELARAGIRLALDDFGTGFSGLSRLKQLPISTVKIDRSFIGDIRNDTNDAVIVASTISLAHNLGLTVVAEGVETRDQLVHLKAAGCDQVQGFYLQRPVAAEQAAAILHKKIYSF